MLLSGWVVVGQDDHRLLRTGDRRVEQAPVVHEGVRLVGDHDRARKFRTLHLMDRRGVRQLNEVLLAAVGQDLDGMAFEVDSEAGLRMILDHVPNGPVHDAEVVIIPRLDDLVAGQQIRPPSRLDAGHIDAEQLLLDEPAEGRCSIRPFRAAPCASVSGPVHHGPRFQQAKT